MAWSNQDAMALNTLLYWICGLPQAGARGSRVPDKDALRAANSLARKAGVTPQGSLSPETLQASWPVRTDLFTPGTCAVCGCTDDRACPGGCWWINGSNTLCSECAFKLGLISGDIDPPSLELWIDLSNWSQATFGSDSERGPIGPLKHLKLEADEAIAKPTDAVEYSDILILLFDAARRAGITHNQLIEVAQEKLQQCKGRKWNVPAADQPTEHVRSDRELRDRAIIQAIDDGDL
jgi:hypothetical protein